MTTKTAARSAKPASRSKTKARTKTQTQARTTKPAPRRATPTRSRRTAGPAKKRLLGMAAPLSTNALPDERLTQYLFDVQRQASYKPDEHTLVVSGLDIRLDDVFDKNLEELRVYGDIVRIDGPLKSADKANISVYCRHALFGPKASLDVSGKAGPDKMGQVKPALEQKNLGEAGNTPDKGEQGGAGTAGGRIVVMAERIVGSPVLRANGGPGGRGQMGGSGGTGGKGKDGDDQKYRTDPVPGSKLRVKVRITRQATPGGPAGRGGKGGAGGDRGKNGNGGLIFVRSVQPPTLGALQADPGQNFIVGPEAKGGPGGKGAAGGRGGYMLYDPAKPGRHIQKRCPNGPDSKEGEKGDDGRVRDEDKGAAGSVDVKIATPAELWQTLWTQEPFLSASAADNSVLAMTLFAAERLYLNAACPEDALALHDVLGWLFRATAEATAPRLQAMHRRCAALLLNLASGLDYYGKLPNFVPSLSFDENRQYYKEYVKIARSLEDDVEKFWAEQQSSAKTRARLEKRLAKMDELIERQLTPKRQELDKSIRGIHDSIVSFTERLQEQETLIRDASEDFHRALLKKLQCDELTAVFNVARSLIQVGVNAVPGFGGLKALSELPFDKSMSLSDRAKPFETIVESLGQVAGNVKEIGAAFGDLSKARATENADAVKLTVKREEFDELMKQFTEIPQAQPYVDAMHGYMDIVNQRNTAIVNHDSACIQLDNVETQIALAEKANAEIARQLAESTNVLRPVFIQYIDESLQLAKSLVMGTLHSMARSLEYYTLSPQVLHFVDYRVSTLEDHYGYLLSGLNRAKEDAGARSPFSRDWVITDPPLLDRLKAGMPVWIAVPLNRNKPPIRPFADIHRPLVRAVRCFLGGATGADPEATATVTVQHCGVSHLFDEHDERVWTFAHGVRTVSFEYRLRDRHFDDDQGDLTEEDQFMRLSPFALWGIQIRPQDGHNDTLDLSKLNAVTLTVVGNGVTRAIAGSRA